MSADKGKKQIAFGGLMLVNFIVMFLIAGVGVYSYTIAAQFESLASVSMIFALECVAMTGSELVSRISQNVFSLA